MGNFKQLLANIANGTQIGGESMGSSHQFTDGMMAPSFMQTLSQQLSAPQGASRAPQATDVQEQNIPIQSLYSPQNSPSQGALSKQLMDYQASSQLGYNDLRMMMLRMGLKA